MDSYKCNGLEWKDIDWPEAKKQTDRLQQRIYKAARKDNKVLVHKLQRRLLCTFYARAIAVRRVTERNRGRETPGVDRTVVVKSHEKMRLVKNLTLDGKAHPIRRIWIPKPGREEKRPLGIPTIRDRAKQMLALLALDPEWEAKFEPNSYGFRPGRGCHDAIRAIFAQCRGQRKWILDADIKGCFDNIDHSKLVGKLDTFPLLRRQVEAWLRAGIMQGFADERPEMSTSLVGTPQGGIVSPLLANVALHGLETEVKNHFAGTLYDGPTKTAVRDRRKQVGVVRYADDFVVIANTRETVQALTEYIDKWLYDNAGLQLSKEKSQIRDTAESFDFLGFSMVSTRCGEVWKFHTRISRKSKARHLIKTREIIQKNKGASAGELIVKLNPVIRGWCNYFRTCECVEDFKQVEYRIFGQIRAWVFRRKSKGLRSREAIKLKYFPADSTVTFDGTKHTGQWILQGSRTGRGTDKVNVFLIYHSWVRSINYVKIAGDASPYDGNHLYWAQRSLKYGSFSASERRLISRQRSQCPLCHRFFQPGDMLEKDHVIRVADGGRNTSSNLQMVHRHCHQIKTNAEAKAKQSTKRTQAPVAPPS
jgi:RNA-directed DNA polymerase